MNNKNLALFFQNTFLLLSRIFVGFVMLHHGYPKLNQLLEGGEIQFFDFLGMGATTTLALTVLAEVVASIFIIFGLLTRWAAFILFFCMSVAVFLVHAADGIDKKELGLLYMVIYLFFIIFGAGKFSLDYLIFNRKKQSKW